jgi:curved DNA-binding protein CbpA
LALDYYEILQVNKNSSQTEIDSQYRRLYEEYDPEKYPETEEVYIVKRIHLKQAYDTLGDSTKRAEYDSKHIQTTSSSGWEKYYPQASRDSSRDDFPKLPPKSKAKASAIVGAILLALTAIALMIYAISIASQPSETDNNISPKEEAPKDILPLQTSNSSNTERPTIPAPHTFVSDRFDSGVSGWSFDSATTRATMYATNKFSLSIVENEGNPGAAAALNGFAIDSAACIRKISNISGWEGSRLVLSFDYRVTYPSTPTTFPLVIVTDADKGTLLYNEHISNYKSGWSTFAKDLSLTTRNVDTIAIDLCLQDSDADYHNKSVWFDNIGLESLV